jgi:hypothetical protein
MPKELDFAYLATILDLNRDKPVTVADVAKLAAMMQSNAMRDAEELKRLTPTDEQMNGRFTI